MTKQQTIIQKIREYCPELAFTSVCRTSEDCPNGVRVNYKKPHLENLLRAIEKSKGGKTYSFGIYTDGIMSMCDYSIDYADASAECKYDLTKTLQQNLDTNPELVDFLYEILV